MNKNLKLNSIPSQLFEYTKGDERSEIVAVGRMLWAESTGRKVNRVRKDGYTTLMDATDYRKASENHLNKLIKFAAERAYAAQGRTLENDNQLRDPALFRNEIFRATLAGIVTEIMRPVIPYVLDATASPLMDVSTVGWNETKEIVVESNDVFVFQDSAYGALRSTPSNTLYKASITLNPRPYDAHATAKWNQLLNNGMDIGRFYDAIYAGLYNKMFAMATDAFTTAAANTYYVPSYMSANSYSTANWATVTQAVAMANGVARDSLMAFGDFAALQAVLPSGTASDAALSTELGEEWFKNGYVGMVARVPLFEVGNAFVPGTVNTTGAKIFPTNAIFVGARAGAGYAPVQAAIADGFTVEFRHSEDGTGDLDIFVEANMDVKPVFASYVGVINNVSL